MRRLFFRCRTPKLPLESASLSSVIRAAGVERVLIPQMSGGGSGIARRRATYRRCSCPLKVVEHKCREPIRLRALQRSCEAQIMIEAWARKCDYRAEFPPESSKVFLVDRGIVACNRDLGQSLAVAPQGRSQARIVCTTCKGAH
jgi:hypothetical protein